jgi:hypothetical protein
LNVAPEGATHEDYLAEEAAEKVNFLKCAKNKKRTVALGRESILGNHLVSPETVAFLGCKRFFSQLLQPRLLERATL